MDILKLHERSDGSYLGALPLSSVPFPVKRVFFSSSGPNKDCQRGDHAHYECEQVLVCLSGVIIIAYENKDTKGVVVLKPGQTFYHKQLEWVKVNFKEEKSVLLSLCSQEYNEDDYIRDYSTFLKALKGAR